MEKTCPECGKLKSIDDFHKNKNKKDGHQSSCKECKGNRSKVRYINEKSKLRAQIVARKQFIREYVNRVKQRAKCAICGIKGSWLLQFHHTTSNKEINIGNVMQHSFSIKKLKEEMRKCIIVCANCHSTIHHNAKL
jgi:hypothetical protein